MKKNEMGDIQPAGFPGLPPGWATECETFPSADSEVQLFMATHRATHRAAPAAPKTDPLAHKALVVVHGMGEHGGRYLHVPHYVQSAVGQVSCIDQRGHGRSEGLRGHCERFTQLTDDLAMVIRRVHAQLMERLGRAEVHVLGHSMGGLATLQTHFLHSNLPVASVTASSPLLGLKLKIPLVKRLAGIVLAEVWGSLQIPGEIDPSELSHDPDVAKAYEVDRLVHTKVTPRMFSEMNKAMADVTGRDTGFEYPLQGLISGGDLIVDAAVSEKFFAQLKFAEARDKKFQVYPGYFHECLNESGPGVVPGINREKVFEDLVSWIKAHSKN